jgi:hypothetical protein
MRRIGKGLGAPKLENPNFLKRIFFSGLLPPFAQF